MDDKNFSVIDDMDEALVMDDPFDDKAEEMRKASDARRSMEIFNNDPELLRNAGLLVLLLMVVGTAWFKGSEKDGPDPCGGICGCCR